MYEGRRAKSEVSVSCFHVVFSIILVLLSGCSQRPLVQDNSILTVQPGLGISNVFEVGMTVQQARDATHGVTIHGINDRDALGKRWGASRFGLIQSLGATAPIERNGEFVIICFHVLPYDSDVTVSGLTVTNPFRGKVGDKLSFKNGLVRREDVELQFGQIDHVITNLSDGIVLARDGKPFLFRAPAGGETLYYRHRGINFDLRSNTVTGFWVYFVTNPGTAETR